MAKTPPESLDLLTPVDHVVLAFADEGTLREAVAALAGAGFPSDKVHEYTAAEMSSAIAAELEGAGALASLGQDVNLAKFRRKLADEGHGWLVVHAPSKEETAQVGEVARRLGARMAQKHNRFMIEELV